MQLLLLLILQQPHSLIVLLFLLSLPMTSALLMNSPLKHTAAHVATGLAVIELTISSYAHFAFVLLAVVVQQQMQFRVHLHVTGDAQQEGSVNGTTRGSNSRTSNWGFSEASSATRAIDDRVAAATAVNAVVAATTTCADAAEDIGCAVGILYR